jgi:hypothetical protein
MKTIHWLILAAIAIFAFMYMQPKELKVKHEGETTSRALLLNTDQSRQLTGCGGSY